MARLTLCSKNPPKFGEQEILVKWLLHPALGIASIVRPIRRRNDAQDHHRNGRRRLTLPELLECFPTAQSGHIKIQQDRRDRLDGGSVSRAVRGGHLCRPLLSNSNHFFP